MLVLSFKAMLRPQVAGRAKSTIPALFFFITFQLIWGIGRQNVHVWMKRAFLKPVLHVVPLPEGTDASVLSQLSVDQLQQVYAQGKELENGVVLCAHPDIIVRQIGDEWILVPTGELAQHFNGMVSLNEFGYFIWQHFLQPCTIGEVLRDASVQYGNSLGMQDIEIRSFIREYALMGLFQEVNNNNK